jgi:hypothetical protein
MSRPSLQDVDRRFVQGLLDIARSARSADRRIDLLSAELVGFPYQPNPLIGSAQSPEVFTARTDHFDCVTFIETVLALANARRIDAFAPKLRHIRYSGGKIARTRRNHYMTEWIRQNIRSGSIRRIPGLTGKVRKNRLLNVVPDLPVRRTAFSCLAKDDWLRAGDKLQTGDLIFFASTRVHLDVFHCGIVIRTGKGLRLRHASRSRGAVVEQDLAEFLKQNRMAGVIVVRPVETA